jgi:hypothetical protein
MDRRGRPDRNNLFQVFRAIRPRLLRQRREQYFTLSQSLAHLRRQLNGRPQRTQVFCGKSRFARTARLGQDPRAGLISAPISNHGFSKRWIDRQTVFI